MQTVNTSMVPPSPVAANNGAICAGQTLQLTATTVPGATYLWIGPNGFSSIQQNPQIPSASAAASGIYQVVAIVGSCESAPASTDAVVRAGPSATITADVVACLSGTNNASVPDAGSGATYAWTISNGTITSGAGTKAITYTAAAPGTVTLGVTVTDANSCTSSSNRSVPMQTTCSTEFFTLPPCRIVDTRKGDAPALAAGADRTFVLAGRCGIPLMARSVAANVTLTDGTDAGEITLYPAEIPMPSTPSLSYPAYRTRADNTLLTLGPNGDITVHCDQPTGTVQLIIDVNGYYQP